jgi:hypothetical protein
MSGGKGALVRICDRREIERMAHILGDASAARLALNEWQRRNEAGENVVILSTGTSLLVGPKPLQTGDGHELD